MGVLIDASVFIDHERGRIDLERRVGDRGDEPFFISVVTASELLHGVHRAATGAQRARRAIFVEAIIDRFPLLDVDLPTARTHAEVRAALSRTGQSVGPNDLWLAAASLAHGLSLATANLREFARVEGLDVEDWTAD
jgi:tRNA(fMet)-specific endonuclease VapC